MLLLTCLLLVPAQLAAQDPVDFPEEFQARALAAVVRVYNPAMKREGSGVIVGKTGAFVYVLTAHHIVTGADGVDITVFSEKSEPPVSKTYRQGRVLAKSDDWRDLALVRALADQEKLGVLPICPVGEAPKTNGFPALALGCSAGQPPTAIVHNALAKKKVRQKVDGETATFWETPGAVVKGRSGGPVVDKRGYVVGICSGTSDGKGYFTPVDEIHRFLKKNAFAWLADVEK